MADTRDFCQMLEDTLLTDFAKITTTNGYELSIAKVYSNTVVNIDQIELPCIFFELRDDVDLISQTDSKPAVFSLDVIGGMIEKLDDGGNPGNRKNMLLKALKKFFNDTTNCTIRGIKAVTAGEYYLNHKLIERKRYSFAPQFPFVEVGFLLKVFFKS